jgi:hypothetical protein
MTSLRVSRSRLNRGSRASGSSAVGRGGALHLGAGLLHVDADHAGQLA